LFKQKQAQQKKQITTQLNNIVDNEQDLSQTNTVVNDEKEANQANNIENKEQIPNGIAELEEKQQNPNELTEEEKEKVAELQKRDQEVRTHENAHIAAGGAYVQGGASYETTKGPDNKEYAVGGEVQIDSSPIPGDPDATIQKMRTVRAAALAPANPSSTDQAVAARAAQQEEKAKRDKMEKEKEEDSDKIESVNNPEMVFGEPDYYDNKGEPVYNNKPQIEGIIS
jgi:hypothetical protein